MRWQAVLHEPAGGPQIGELADVDNVQLTERLDHHDEATLNLKGSSAGAQWIRPFATDLMLYRDGVARFRGRILAPRDTLTPDGHTVAVTAVSYRRLLASRILQAGLVFTGVDQEAIGWGIIDHLQAQTGGQLGITRDGTPTGVVRDRTYAAGDNAGQRLDELGRVINGHDWDITPALVWRAWAARGAAFGTPLEWGSSVSRVTGTPDVEAFANAVRVTGDDTTVPETRTAADLATAEEGRWDATVGFHTVSQQTTVAEHADGELERREQLRTSWQLLLAPGVTGLGPGDTARMIIRAGRLDVDDVLRVHEVVTDARPASGGEDITVTLDAPTPDLAGVLAASRRRLTQLERTS